MREGIKYMKEQARKNIINTTNLHDILEDAKAVPILKKNITL